MKYFPIILIIFIFFIVVPIKCYYNILEKEEFYNIVKSDKRGQKYYLEVIENLEKILNYYVYLELAKNPPQPSFDPNYFPKVDTIGYLENLKTKITEDTNSYDFYRDLKILIDGYKDAHMSYGFKGYNYSKYVFLCPIKIKTKINSNNEIYSTGEMEFQESYFRNGTEIIKIINKNKDEPIKYINNMPPIQFIQTYGNPFMQLKNVHASYAFKTHLYLSAFALYFPLNSEEISNFTVEYENGEKFETDFAIAEIVSNPSKNSHKFFDNENIEIEFMKYLENKFDEKYGKPKSLSNLINEFESFNNCKNSNNLLNKNKDLLFQNILTNSEKNEIKWDYEYYQNKDNIFQCRVDEEKQVNVYHLTSFIFNDMDKAFGLLKNCTDLFSSNQYNIIIILNFNGGGIELFAQTMVEYIQPLISSRFYSTLKKGEYLSKYYDINFSDNSIRKTCKVPDKKYVLENTISIDYGQNVINNITYPFTRFGQYRDEFNNVKKLIKNKRKPTEILIFTDGYSASSTSLFTKSLQNEGGAIIAGYNGNPENKEIFDSSQHFSSVISWSDLKKIDENTTSKLEELEIKFSQICITNNYLDYNNLKVPEEYNIMEVDVVTDIYESFDANLNYDLFIDKGKQIFEKYIAECNIKNNKLTLFNENCKFKDDNYAHGGYGCGNNGKWNESQCIPIYCDEGYFFDNIQSKCVKDPCIKKFNSSKTNKIQILFLFILIALLS